MRDGPAIAERRSAPRHHLVALVTFPGGSGLTRDLSTTGLFFLTDRPFALGQRVQLSITLEHADPESPTELTCRGRVCRVERQMPEPPGGTAVGVAVAADSFDFPGGPSALTSVQERGAM
jgi:PilZ domain